jgi:hypothetical protein
VKHPVVDSGYRPDKRVRLSQLWVDRFYVVAKLETRSIKNPLNEG